MLAQIWLLHASGQSSIHRATLLAFTWTTGARQHARNIFQGGFFRQWQHHDRKSALTHPRERLSKQCATPTPDTWTGLHPASLKGREDNSLGTTASHHGWLEPVLEVITTSNATAL